MQDEFFNGYQEKITWTKEQKSCLDYTGSKTLMVKGVAGAGKSLLIYGLAKKLLENYSEEKKNKVAIFTFSNTLNSATKQILEINGEQEDYITVTTLHSYITKVYQAMHAPKFKIFWKEEEKEQHKKEAIQIALDEHRKQYGSHRFHRLGVDFWMKEFDWMKDMNISVGNLDGYLALSRKGRAGQVRMNLMDRAVAFQIFNCYEKVLQKRGEGDWVDYSLYLIRNADKIPEEFKFDHILIDEAQDFSLTEMKAAMLFSKKDMVIAMDANQRIHDRQWTPKMLGIEATTKKLTKSMRTTKQIDALAESIRQNNDKFMSEEEASVRAIPEREGPLPQLVHLADLEAEKKYVTDLVKAFLKQNDKISIGIIAARNKWPNKQINLYSSWMADAGIPHEIIERDSSFSMSTPGVKIVGAYNVKGLEFSRVIIPQFEEGNFPYNYYRKLEDEEEKERFLVRCRNLVYVGMTRAKFSLTLTYKGEKGSPFISEMEKGAYEKIESVAAPVEKKEVELPHTVLPKDQPSKEMTYEEVLALAQSRKAKQKKQKKILKHKFREKMSILTIFSLKCIPYFRYIKYEVQKVMSYCKLYMHGFSPFFFAETSQYKVFADHKRTFNKHTICGEQPKLFAFAHVFKLIFQSQFFVDHTAGVEELFQRKTAFFIPCF